MNYAELKEKFQRERSKYPAVVVAQIEMQLRQMETELRRRGELPQSSEPPAVSREPKPPAPKPQSPMPTAQSPQPTAGSVVSVTSNCIVRRHTLNNIIEIEFKRYPGAEVYRALAGNGFEKRKGKERTFWAQLNDAHYQFALKLCQGREEQGKQAVIDKAKYAERSDTSETAKRVEFAEDVDFEKLTNGVERVLSQTKIGYNSLADEVKEKIEGNITTFKVDVPNVSTPTMTGKPPKSFQKIIDDVQMYNNVMLIGGAGTGKTYLAELVAEALGRQKQILNCSQWTTQIDILGGDTIDSYREGKLTRAWKEGSILILDEMPKLDPNTAGLLNDGLAKGKRSGKGSVIENTRGEKFEKHKDFGCIATGNVYPSGESAAYGANNKQDLSLLDRFAGCVYFIEGDPGLEQTIIQNNIVWSVCAKLRETIETNRYESQVSLRMMQVSRDAWNLEMERVKKKSAQFEGLANAGKNFRDVVDSFLSTFTKNQQEVLRQAINYDKFIGNYHYRDLAPTAFLYDYKKAE